MPKAPPLTTGAATRPEAGPASTAILLIEDRISLREMLQEFLGSHGFLVTAGHSRREGLELISRHRFDLALLDLRLPDGSGLDLLQALRQDDPALPVILMTAFGTIEDSVQAMKAGAVDFIQKPLQLDALLQLIRKSLESRRLQVEPLLFQPDFQTRHRLPLLISRNPAMQELARQVQRIAATGTTVLLTGESGTGKELFARAIHLLSPAAAGPFVEVNCAAIPDTLIENELFGHVRGAYTGADSGARGKFELAAGGTLFLDEIGEIPLPVQAKLLKALETKRITPIGGRTPLTVEVRIVAATNRDLQREMEEGRFRGDLFYRLAAFPVRLPPLRERPEDIPLLARHFQREMAARMSLPDHPVTPGGLAALCRHSWPGNVRELKNLVERALVVDTDAQLTETDFFPALAAAPAPAATVPWEQIQTLGLDRWLPEVLAAHERAALLEAGRRHPGDLSAAAASLGLSCRQLSARLKKTGLDGEPLFSPGREENREE